MRLTVTYNERKAEIFGPQERRAVARAVAKQVERVIAPAVERRMNRTLQLLPGKPKYPIRWASDKQRRYVMAKLRERNNLPYRRTGKLARGWQVLSAFDAKSDSGTLTVENPASIAKYIYGPEQQPFHQDTGWPDFAKWVEQEQERAVNDLMGVWPDILIDALDLG